MKISSFLAVSLLGTVMAASPARAEVVFSEDFESDVYLVDLPIPLGFGVIKHGCWNPVPKQARPGTVVEYEGGRVLELRAVESFKRGARAIGSLGKTNDEATPVSEAIRWTFSFKMTAPLTNGLFMQLGGSDGRSKATLNTSEEGLLLVSFAGARQQLHGEPLVPNQWYTVQVDLPARPRTSSLYEARLYEGKGTEKELNRAKGRMARSVTNSDYSSFDLQHQQAGEALLIDDLRVETIEPTP